MIKLASINGGGVSGTGFETAAEIAAVAESAQFYDPADFQIRFRKIPAGCCEATGIEIPHDRGSGDIFKQM